MAGGRGSKSGELPIFVTSVPPHGCLARDGRIKRGKIGSSTISPHLLPEFNFVRKKYVQSCLLNFLHPEMSLAYVSIKPLYKVRKMPTVKGNCIF